MINSIYLAWRYILSHRIKSVILICCITLTIFLPLIAHFSLNQVQSRWESRAKSTPLLVGSKGSRFDLVLHSLYFMGHEVDPLSMEEHDKIRKSKLAQTIPLFYRYTAQDFPIVGTSLGYFSFRGLTIEDGTMLTMLGDCIIGSQVSIDLNLHPGDRLLSDTENMFNLAGSYPLNMKITGVLTPSGTPDDQAIFVDLKTSWVIHGLAHGHEDLSKTKDKSVILQQEEDNIIANAALIEYTTITPDNIASFHFHAEDKDLPLTAIIAIPFDEKSQTLLRGRFLSPEGKTQILLPEKEINDLMDFVFKIKQLFNLSMALLAIAMLLFLALTILLSLRLRQSEMKTMFYIGCSRLTIFKLQVMELFLIVTLSLGLAATLTFTLAPLTRSLIVYLISGG
jgi:putative ABC transport system permease protein